jgi:hypothetical protein
MFSAQFPYFLYSVKKQVGWMRVWSMCFASKTLKYFASIIGHDVYELLTYLIYLTWSEHHPSLTSTCINIIYMYVCIYIYVCVCVCVCVFIHGSSFITYSLRTSSKHALSCYDWLTIHYNCWHVSAVRGLLASLFVWLTAESLPPTSE